MPARLDLDHAAHGVPLLLGLSTYLTDALRCSSAFFCTRRAEMDHFLPLLVILRIFSHSGFDENGVACLIFPAASPWVEGIAIKACEKLEGNWTYLNFISRMHAHLSRFFCDVLRALCTTSAHQAEASRSHAVVSFTVLNLTSAKRHASHKRERCR
jgi:hypothetical protein